MVNESQKGTRLHKQSKRCAASANRGIDIIKGAMDTYFVVDPATGSLIELDSTAVADISLFAEGAKYLAGTAADFLTL